MRRTPAPLSLFVAFSLAACTAATPTSVHLTLRAAANLNPDTVGLPNPVQTHVYMLKAAEIFGNTDYFQLADKERAVLGGDLLLQADNILRPGQTLELDVPAPPGTSTVGVTAAFRNIDGGTWRVAAPLKARVTVDFGTQNLLLRDSK